MKQRGRGLSAGKTGRLGGRGSRFAARDDDQLRQAENRIPLVQPSGNIRHPTETTHPHSPNSRAIAAKIPGKWLAPGQVDDSCMPSPIVDPLAVTHATSPNPRWLLSISFNFPRPSSPSHCDQLSRLTPMSFMHSAHCPTFADPIDYDVPRGHRRLPG